MSADEKALYFGAFCLAGPHGPLFLNGSELKLPPKALATLWLLAGQAGQVVTRAAILDSVWADTAVGLDALGFQIRLLRHALGDDPRVPRYIQTVHRVGYRFVAPVRVVTAGSSREPLGAVESQAPSSRGDLVGREAELARLDAVYRAALDGHRQLVFVTGEAGVGKTALVTAAFADVVATGGAGTPRIAHGHCVARRSAGEAYLPLLDALARLASQDDAVWIRDVLRRHAPGWLRELPSLAEALDAEGTAWRLRAGGRRRMLREMLSALDVLASDRPLILVLEDLHWADQYTVDLLGMVARRSERACLLIVGTYRPSEVLATRHPLQHTVQELRAHGRTVDIRLECLGPQHVSEFVARRFHEAAPGHADLIYVRTGGHPLFMAQLTAALRTVAGSNAGDAAALTGAEGVAAVPPGVRALVDAEFGRLRADVQRLLEAASAGGVEFDSPSLAAALGARGDAVEEACEHLARTGQFIVDLGPSRWPDGTLSVRYRFRHAFVREVIYGSIGRGRAARLHLAIAARKARGYGERVAEIAGELAAHYDAGGDARQAALYYRQAGERALRHHAYNDAVSAADKGISALEREAAGADLIRLELHLHVTRGAALLASRGFSAPEVHATFTRAHALCAQIDDAATRVPVLYGLWNYHLTRGDLAQARGLAAQLVEAASAQADPGTLVQALCACGWSALFVGDPAAAAAVFDQAVAQYDGSMHPALMSAYGEDGGIGCYQGAALANWLIGRYARVEQALADGATLARRLLCDFGLAQMLWVDALLGQQEGRAAHVREVAGRLIELCEDQGFPLWLVGGRIFEGWARAKAGDVPGGEQQMRQALREWESAGTVLTYPFCLALLAELALGMERVDEGLALVDEAIAIASRTGERWYESELHRLRGELLDLRQPLPGGEDAETCLRRALAIAGEQRARSLELRAALTLARLWHRRGRAADARRLLDDTLRQCEPAPRNHDFRMAGALLARWTPP